ncbi:hypothetical protein K6119_17125 [Paracrocinitomix mangrovi]|uniref:hypothetical protein n=1 Tax=Paracrocinitomix mangrovi TaxID=2862509 RepID=UPI001C8E17B6|nr:hypothetical protein [Paracrocinitomix mangrovi]UKN01450.1 hypothetical protein K6119_17125 [Paracrocinitomix mangrovi]
MGARIGTLGLVNYRKHPEQERFRVFAFGSEEEADMFQTELEKRNIWFERGTEEAKQGQVYLFGVDKSDFKQAMQANYAVAAKHRDPMIKNKFLRYALVILTASLVTLGLIGYVKNMNKLKEETEKIQQD